MTSNMATAVICIGLLGLLLFVLGFAVSLARANSRVLIGSSDDPALLVNKLIRAHGNTAEYAPMLAILMLYLGTTTPPLWVVWTMIVATASRYVLVAGLLTGAMDKANPLRFLGALGTYIAGAALAIAALLTVP